MTENTDADGGESLADKIRVSRRTVLSALGAGGAGAVIGQASTSNGGEQLSMGGVTNLTEQKRRETYVTSPSSAFDPSALKENELFWVSDTGEIGIKGPNGPEHPGLGSASQPVEAVHTDELNNTKFASTIDEISTKLTELGNAGGGELVLPAAPKGSPLQVMDADTGIAVPENVKIVGHSQRGTWFELQENITSPLFDASGISGNQHFSTQFANFGVGAAANRTYGGGTTPIIDATYSALCEIDNVEIQHIVGTAIDLTAAWDFEVENTHVTHCGDSSTSAPTVKLGDTAEDIVAAGQISGGHFARHRHRGIEVENALHVRISDTKLHGQGGEEYALLYVGTDVQDFRVSDVSCNAVQDPGGVHVAGGDDITVHNLSFSAGPSPKYWLQVTGGSAIQISDCKMGATPDSGGASTNPINVTGGSDVEIVGCLIDGNSTGFEGIHANTPNLVIRDCTVHHMGRQAVKVQSDGCQIEGCKLYNNGQETADTYAATSISASDTKTTNCHIYDDQATPTQKHAVIVGGAGTANVIVKDNRIHGHATAAYSIGKDKTEVVGNSQPFYSVDSNVAAGGSATHNPNIPLGVIPVPNVSIRTDPNANASLSLDVGWDDTAADHKIVVTEQDANTSVDYTLTVDRKLP